MQEEMWQNKGTRQRVAPTATQGRATVNSVPQLVWGYGWLLAGMLLLLHWIPLKKVFLLNTKADAKTKQKLAWAEAKKKLLCKALELEVEIANKQL